MRLKTEVKTQNTTQEWIAGKIGVPLSTFRKWMIRKTYPNLKQGVEIAKLLETSAEYLVTGVDPNDLSNAEQHILNSFRQLSREDKENLTITIEAWLEKRMYYAKR